MERDGVLSIHRRVAVTAGVFFPFCGGSPVPMEGKDFTVIDVRLIDLLID